MGGLHAPRPVALATTTIIGFLSRLIMACSLRPAVSATRSKAMSAQVEELCSSEWVDWVPGAWGKGASTVSLAYCCIHRRAAAACFGLVTPPDSLPDLRTYCAKAERQDAPNFQARFKHHHQGARRRRIRGMTPLTVCRNTVPSESPTYTCPSSASAMLTPSEPPTLPADAATPDAMV